MACWLSLPLSEAVMLEQDDAWHMDPPATLWSVQHARPPLGPASTQQKETRSTGLALALQSSLHFVHVSPLHHLRQLAALSMALPHQSSQQRHQSRAPGPGSCELYCSLQLLLHTQVCKAVHPRVEAADLLTANALL